MPVMEPDEEQIEAVCAHWLKHRCMPFPADGLVPRERSAPLPDQPEEAAHQAARLSAQFAAALMEDDALVVQQRENPKSQLTTLAAQAAIGFATRHPELLDANARKSQHRGRGVDAAYHPGAVMARSMERMLQDQEIAERRFEPFGHYLECLGVRCEARNISSEAPAHVPYAFRHSKHDGYLYPCSCQTGYREPTRPRPVKPRDPARLQPVLDLLQHPGAEWWLLSRVLLAALHSHLGWIPNERGNKATGQHLLNQRVVTLLLRRVQLAETDEAAGLAGGLAQGMQWRPAGHARSAAAQLSALDHTLTDTMPQPLENLHHGTLRWLCFRATQTRFFEDHLTATLHLARDLASDHTSPPLTLESGATPESWDLLRKHTDYTGSPWRKLAKRLKASLKAQKQGDAPPDLLSLLTTVDEAVNADFVVHELLPRLYAVASYHAWMHDRGHKLVAQLLNVNPR